MIIPCRINVIAVTNNIRLMYAVYMCKDISNVVQYVGIAPLSDLLTLEDAFCNSEFTEIFGQPNTPIELICEHITEDEKEAREQQRILITMHNPHCNRKGYYIHTKNQYVKCNETGETFRNTVEATKHHGVTYSALYNHLKRKPGHKTVKGRTYSYTIKWKGPTNV